MCKTKLLLPFVSLLMLSCSNHDFRVYEGSGNCPVMLEIRKFGGFDMRLINLGKQEMQGLKLIFDGKYEHPLKGLYSVETGLIKDSVFRPSDTLTFQFNEEISNLLYFDVQEKIYVPEQIELIGKDCSTKWNLK